MGIDLRIKTERLIEELFVVYSNRLATDCKTILKTNDFIVSKRWNSHWEPIGDIRVNSGSSPERVVSNGGHSVCVFKSLTPTKTFLKHFLKDQIHCYFSLLTSITIAIVSTNFRHNSRKHYDNTPVVHLIDKRFNHSTQLVTNDITFSLNDTCIIVSGMT